MKPENRIFTALLLVVIINLNCTNPANTPSYNNISSQNISNDSFNRKSSLVQNKSKEQLKYEVVKNEVYDIPIKTQVSIDILIKNKEIEEEQLRELLTSIYYEQKETIGFKYHEHPNHIYIYAYTSKEKEESGQGQWIGFLGEQNGDEPTIQISQIEFQSLDNKPEEKFGLPEKKRMEIWNALILAENQAWFDATIKYPTNIDNPNANENIYRQNDLYDKLLEKYNNVVLKKYNLNQDIADSIDYEATAENWALPKLKQLKDLPY